LPGSRVVAEPLLASPSADLLDQLRPEVVWIGAAVIALAVVLYFILRPPALVRPLGWLVAHTIYRVRVLRVSNLPASGAALIVRHHVSCIDWLLLLVGQKRFILFVIFAGWTRVWGLRHLLRWAGVIPIDASAGPRAIVQSLRQASEALGRGELVCIFA